MAKKNNSELLIRFQKLEAELIEVLKIEPIEFDENTAKGTVKKEINGYIKKLKKAKAVFEEYEKVAEKIKKASESEQTLVQEVVELRAEPDEKELEKIQKIVNEKNKGKENTEYENVVQVDESGVKVISKKKETKKSVKEL